MNEEKKLAALRMLSRPKIKKPLVKKKAAKKQLTSAKPAGHSCYSCIHYITEQSPDLFEHAPLTTTGNRKRYCDETNSHNLRTWPFTHTICDKWEHERAPQVEDEPSN